MSHSEIHTVINSIWTPDITFNFPIHKNFDKNKKGQTSKFQFNWLLRWRWLAYSEKEDGAFCKLCVAFSKSEGGINGQKLGALVINKFDNWKHAIETFTKHDKLNYHIKSVIDTDNFLKTRNNPSISIENQLDTARSKQVNENRINVLPIIEVIILCGRQELAIRGHRDFGKISVDTIQTSNEGNFRELLRYRARGDLKLKTFLEGPGERNKYISPTSQNAIIDCCNTVILNKIVAKINKAKCFTVLADETADISGIEQVSLCAKYVDVDEKVVREDFLQFVPTNDLTGKGLATLIIENLKAFGIELKYLRGQGYDGAAAMSGQFNGVRSHISQLYPMATYVHCTAHTLNLAVSKSCTIQPIRNCLGTIGKIRDFFVYPKRKNILSQAIEEFNGTINAKTLKRNCATRWIERFHSVHDFIELLECVIDSLDTISSWADGDTSSQANNLKNSILQGEFIISLLVLSKIFAIGLPLSKQFQSVAIDLREAMVLANATLSELKTIRSNVDEYFHDIYTKAFALAQELCFSITLPRIARKQKNRDNYSVNTPEEYFKITIFIPYLDLFINEIESRFIEHQKILKGFQNLFPKTLEMSTLEKDEFISLIDFYNDDLVDNNKDILISELKLWQRKILALDKQPKNAMDALIICNDMYPNIYKLLQILATLPVSTASSERSFSSLKRIKTYLRNTMSEVFI